MVRWKKGLAWIITGAFMLGLVMLLVFAQACSERKREGYDPIGPERRLQASLEWIIERKMSLEKNLLGGEFGKTLDSSVAMVEAKNVPPTPFLMVALLVRNKEHLAYGWLGLSWLKKEENPELSTLHEIIIRVGQGKTARDFTVPLVATDTDRLMPQGYVWERGFAVDIVPGEAIGHKASEGGTDSDTKGETILQIGEELVNQPLTVFIRDKAGHQSNPVRIVVSVR